MIKIVYPPPDILSENIHVRGFFLYLDAKSNWLTDNLWPVVLCDCIWHLPNPGGRPSQWCLVSPASILVKILKETTELSNRFLFIKGLNETIIDICNESWYLAIELVYIRTCYTHMQACINLNRIFWMKGMLWWVSQQQRYKGYK